MCVTFSVSISSRIFFGSTLRKHTCVAPAAVTAYGKIQPLQWNMGNVQRYTLSGRIFAWKISACAFTNAPRYVYITPFGRPVVPLV